MTMINLNQIKNIMTIRYDPNEKVIFPILKPSVYNSCIDDFDGKITQNFLEQNISDVTQNNSSKISISLSSGIDSSLTLALLRKIYPTKKLFAFCGVFIDSFDESITAKKIAENFEVDFKTVHMKSVFTDMPKIISITKKPKWNTYNHLISKNAKKFSDILFTGDGADEIFCGYTFRYQKFLKLIHKNDDWVIKTKKYLECHNRDWVPDQNEIFYKSLNFNWDEIYKNFKEYFNNNLDPFQQLILADFNGKLLFDFIPTTKAISNHYGIEIFSPFLKSNIINHGFGLSMKQKYEPKSNKGKLILRKISKRLGIEHIDEKRGFTPSLLNDWENHGKSICSTFLIKKDSEVFQNKLINFDWVSKAFDKVNDEGDIRYLNRLISILALEIWYRLFVSKTLNPNKKL